MDITPTSAQTVHLRFDLTLLEIKLHKEQLGLSVIHTTGKGTSHQERNVAVIVKVSARDMLYVKKSAEIKFRFLHYGLSVDT